MNNNSTSKEKRKYRHPAPRLSPILLIALLAAPGRSSGSIRYIVAIPRGPVQKLFNFGRPNHLRISQTK